VIVVKRDNPDQPALEDKMELTVVKDLKDLLDQKEMLVNKDKQVKV
jgi:hypothetical protein